MSVFDWDVILTLFTAVGFTSISVLLFRKFFMDAYNVAMYRLAMGHIFFGLSLSLQLVTMIRPDLPCLPLWVARVLYTLGHMYIAYAFILLARPCTMPLLKSVVCPFCTLDTFEPPECRQSEAQVLFTVATISFVVLNVFALGAHPLLLQPAESVGYYRYATPRLPIEVGMLHLVLQATSCLSAAYQILRHFKYTSVAMIMLAIAFVSRVLGSLLTMTIAIMEYEQFCLWVTPILGAIYIGINIVARSLYLSFMAWLTLFQHHNMFFGQQYHHLVTVDRHLSDTDTMKHSINDMTGGWDWND